MRTIRTTWRRLRKPLVRLVVLWLLWWLLSDPALRGKVNWGLAIGYTQLALQFLFYTQISFSFALSLVGWYIYAHTRVAIPPVCLRDYVGQPEVLARAQEWIKHARLGMPRTIVLSGERYSGRLFLAECIAGELGVPFFEMDGAELMLLGASGLPKLLWYFWRVRRAAKKTGVVAVIQRFEQVAAVPSLFGIPYVTALYRRLLAEIISLHVHVGWRDRLRNTVRRLRRLPPAPPRNAVLFFGIVDNPSYLLWELFGIQRMEETMLIGPPAIENRLSAVQHFLSKVAHEEGLDEEQISKWIANMPMGRVAAFITLDAPRWAMLNGRMGVAMQDFKAAYYQNKFGGRLLQPLPPREAENVAYHEAGHAVASKEFLPDMLVDGLSIIARTGYRRWLPYFGVAWQYASIEDVVPSHERMKAYICVAYAGGVAEALKYGHATLGVGGDQRAIRRMALALYATGAITRWVRPPKQIAFAPTQWDLQPAAEEKLEELLDGLYLRTQAYLQKHWVEVETLAQALLVRKELTQEEIYEVLASVPAEEKKDV